MKKINFTSHPLITGFLILTWVFSGSVLPIHGQLTTVGILPFYNEPGVDMPAVLLPKISLDLQQKLLTYTDILPRVMATEMDLESYKSMNVQQLMQYGMEKGVMFLVRGGILSLSAEQPGKKQINIKIEFYAEVISVKSANLTSVRAQGNGTGKGRLTDSGIQGASIPLSGKEFQDSALAKALTDGLTQLASQLHEAVQALSASDETAEALPPGPEVAGEEEEYIEAEATEPETEQQLEAEQPSAEEQYTGTEYADAESEQAEVMSTAETDEELQQLITQAEELIYNSSAGSETIEVLSQIVAQLKEALNSKLTLMEQGGDTSQIDQQIAELKQNLESTISTITQQAEVSYGEQESSGEQTTSEEKRSFLSQIGEILDESLNVIQKIKELRSTVKGFDQESLYEETMEAEQASEQDQQTEAEVDQGEPMEESTEEVSGVVTEEGEPVEGATVTDPESGLSTTTDSSGAYVLGKIPAGRFSNLLVMKNGKQVAVGKVDLIQGRAAIADFELKSRLSKKGLSSVRIIPASVIIPPQEKYKGKKGTLKGVIQDDQGKPIARALVKVKGLGMARTDSRGQYVFMNVPVGTHQLSINKSGMNIKTQQVNVTPGKINFNAMQFTSRDKVLGKREKMPIIIPQSAALITGVITDESNRPVVGAKVTVFHSSGAVSVLTGRNGVYRLKGLKPGNYRILISKTGLANSSHSIDVLASGTKKYDFKLNKSPEYIQKVLATKKSALKARTGERKFQLIGRITDSGTGKPLAYVTVYIKGYKSFKTDRYGNYSVQDLPPGNYSAAISMRGYQTQNITITIGKTGSGRKDFVLKSIARIEPGKTSKVITLKQKPSFNVMKVQNGQIRGYVNDAKTGKPIAGAVISISGRSYITNSQGMYTGSGLAPGTYTISVGKNGYNSSSLNINVQAGKTSTANFRLNALVLRLYKRK